jgi:hypothetical protein
MKGFIILFKKIINKDCEKYLDYLFYLGFFCVLFLWSLMLRYNDAPDELGRYSICQYIFNHGKLPHGGDVEIRLEAWGFSYAFQPILPYIFGGIMMKFTSLFTQNAYFYLIAARFISVICGVIMAVYVRKISKRIFADIKWQWIFTLLVMLLPQNMFMFVYVNTDSMALMSAAIITYAWLLGNDTNWNLKSCITLSFGIILCAMSYYNAYAFIFFSGIIFTIYHISYNRNTKKLVSEWNNLLKKAFLVSILVFIGTGWWFIRSYILYDGDFLGLHIRNIYAEKFASPEYLKPSHAITYYNAGKSIFSMLKETDYLYDTYISFIGQFGNMSIVLHSWIYFCYTIIFILGFLGLILHKRGNIALPGYNIKNLVTFNLCMAGCIFIPNFLSLYSSYSRDYQPQGRYLLPMLIPFMYFVSQGLKNLSHIVIKDKLLYKVFITILISWFFFVTYFFMKDMVFQNYWNVFINYIKELV